MVFITANVNSRRRKAFMLFGIVLSMLLETGQPDESIGLCCLCDACKPAYRMNFFIDDRGTTCRELALEMADPSNGSKQGNPECRTLQRQHKQTCCDPNYDPVEIPQAPGEDPKNPYSSGKFNPCDLCSGGKYPEKPNTLVAVLNHPDPDTCKDLYWYALAGRIEDSWCRPMQNYYESPCGCASGSAPPAAGGGSDDSGGSGGGSKDSPSIGILQKVVNWLVRLF